MPKIRTPRSRGLAALLLAVLAGTGVAVPWLHTEVSGTTVPVVQEHHDPGTCVPLHDHWICVQHQHARWLSAAPAPGFGTARLLWAPLPSPERLDPSVADDPVSLPRAPPLS